MRYTRFPNSAKRGVNAQRGGASCHPGDPADSGTANLELHTAWRAGAPLGEGEFRPSRSTLGSHAGEPREPAPQTQDCPAQPSGRPGRGPTASPARLGPAGTQRSTPAGQPDSVSPGSPQLPVVFLLLEQLPRLRHGRTRRANSLDPAEYRHHLHEHAGALSAPSPSLPPARRPQGAPPPHCARFASPPGSTRPQPTARTRTEAVLFLLHPYWSTSL